MSLLVFTLGLATAGALVWWRRLAMLAPPAGPARECALRASDVSIIVPARDEAHNLPALLASLARLTPPPGQIIVVDDHSTDGTGDIARAAGMEVVTPPALPRGWLGKPWACATGARVARGAAVLFTDADTTFAPDTLSRALARLEASGADLLSVVPTHLGVRFWEKLQGVFQLLLLVAARAGGGGREFAIGQFLLFRREAYDALGGHGFVRERVAEDLQLARGVVDAGGRYVLLGQLGLLHVRMYPEGLGAFVRGWRRNFREGLHSAGPGGVVEIALVFGWLTGVPVALASAAGDGVFVNVVVLAAAQLATLVELARRQRQVGALPAWGVLGYPFMLSLFAWCTLCAALDELRRAPITWRGRSLAPPPRR